MGCFDDPSGGMCGGGGGGGGGMPGMPGGGGGGFLPGGMTTGGGGMPGGMCGSGSSGGNTSGGNTGGNTINSVNQSGPTSEDGNGIEKVIGSTRQVYKSAIPWFDPLGANESGNFEAPTGGPEQRKFIFDAMTAMRPELAANSAKSVQALQGAAANPGYASAAGLANRTINGDYLNGSPQFDANLAATRNAATREMDNQNAAIQGQFARNGMPFSTANQQAQQSNNALAESQLNQNETAARAANYANERNNQIGAVNTLNQATGAPINYLSQVPAADLAPLSMAAQMVTGLSGGGQPVVDPQDIVERDGYLRQLTKSIGAL